MTETNSVTAAKESLVKKINEQNIMMRKTRRFIAIINNQWIFNYLI
jgi:hypothetical protein